MPEVALKKGWTRVVFGDVVKLRGERSSNPEEDGFERFVGLEHIDPGDLKIRRWGDIADGTTFTSVFRPGHVLFGKRRAYQRKVGVADFSGVCSGDIYVLEPKNAHLLPELLPFICQTDGFFEHAVGTSAGSLSPRTKWESLAAYEFALPPLEEQGRIARALQSAEGTTERYVVAHRQSVVLLESINEHVFKEFTALRRIDDFCDINSESLSSDQLNSEEVWDYIDLSSVAFPRGIVTTVPVQLNKAPLRARRVSRSSDVLVSTVRPNLRGHAVVGPGHGPLVVSTGFTVLRPTRTAFRDLLFGFILSGRFLIHCQARVSGTAYPAVRSSDVAAFTVPDFVELIGSGYGEIYQHATAAIESSWLRFAELQKILLPSLRDKVIAG